MQVQIPCTISAFLGVRYLGWTFPVDLKEQPVFGHGVIDARAAQDQSIAAAKRGNQNGNGHQAPRLEPNICCNTAVPTRSEAAYLMPRETTSAPLILPSNGRCAR